MKTKYCAVCGVKKELQNHHFNPISLGGKDEDTNILTLCTLHHNFIHKMKLKLNHNQMVKNTKQKRIKDGFYTGGYMPYGYKKLQTFETKNARNIKVDLVKIGFDYGSAKYKILCDIMSLYKNPIKTYREFQTYILKKYNIKVHYSHICKVRKNELKKNFEYWKDKINDEAKYTLFL